MIVRIICPPAIGRFLVEVRSEQTNAGVDEETPKAAALSAGRQGNSKSRAAVDGVRRGENDPNNLCYK